VSIKILLADSHRMFRDGLRSLFANQLDIKVVGETDNGRSALELVRDLSPDVVLLGVSMSELNGIETARKIVADYPATRVVVFSLRHEPPVVAEALSAGASAFIDPHDGSEELLRSVRVAHGGGLYLSEKVTGVVVGDYLRHLPGSHQTQAHRVRLSPREREVLQLIAEGKSMKQVASALHVSVKTAEGYRRQIMDKVGIYNVPGLVKLAIREGLASLD